MSDVEQFNEQAVKVCVQAGDSHPWERGSAASLPQLSALLTAASVTPVMVDNVKHELCCWGPESERRGWLCELPPHADNESLVHPTHTAFWRLCGGIVDCLGDDEEWLCNQTEVLTRSAITEDIDGPIDAYSWIWEENSIQHPKNYPSSITSLPSKQMQTLSSRIPRAGAYYCLHPIMILPA